MLDSKAQEQINQFNEHWHAVDKLYEEYAKTHGHTYMAMEVLSAIYESPEGYTQKQICQKTFLPKQSVNTIIKGFWQQGLVELEEIKTDRRNKIVRLSKAGKKYADNVVGRLWQAQDDAMAQMSTEQRQVLIQTVILFEESLRANLAIGRNPRPLESDVD